MIIYSLFLIFSLIQHKFGDIYQSCSDAVTRNNGTSGIYNISPRGNGKFSPVQCNMINETHVETIFDNDAESLVVIKDKDEDLGYPFFIKYEDFDEKDLKEARKFVGECSQEMYFKSFRSSEPSNNFIFFDGLQISYNNASDGVCRCFIKEPCDKFNDVNTVCEDSGTVWYNPVVEHSGLLSIKSNRLPIVKLLVGDTSSDEFISFKIGKLNCTNHLFPSLDIYERKTCDNNWSVMFDKSNTTCLNLNLNYGFIRINSLIKMESVNVITNDENCSSLTITAMISDSLGSDCKLKSGCNFICEPSKTFRMIVNSFKKSTEVCELNIQYTSL